MIKKGGQNVDKLSFACFKVKERKGLGPSHQWLKFEVRDDIYIPQGQVLMLKFFPESADNKEKGNFVMEVNNQNNQTQNYQKPQNYQNQNFQNQGYGQNQQRRYHKPQAKQGYYNQPNPDHDPIDDFNN